MPNMIKNRAHWRMQVERLLATDMTVKEWCEAPWPSRSPTSTRTRSTKNEAGPSTEAPQRVHRGSRSSMRQSITANAILQ